MANCTTYLYDDSRLGCALPSGHDGPHVTGSGRGWHDSDDMGVSVTATLIEKEAEESPSVDYEAMWWEAERRAEKAEAERDRWHSMWRQRGVKHLAAEKRATRAEAERDEWREVALQERGAALDALEQVKVRDARIKAVEDVLTTVEDGHSTDPVIRGMFPRMVNTDLIRRALDGDA